MHVFTAVIQEKVEVRDQKVETETLEIREQQVQAETRSQELGLLLLHHQLLFCHT